MKEVDIKINPLEKQAKLKININFPHGFQKFDIRIYNIRLLQMTARVIQQIGKLCPEIGLLTMTFYIGTDISYYNILIYLYSIFFFKQLWNEKHSTKKAESDKKESVNR